MNPQETDALGRFVVDIRSRFGLTVFDRAPLVGHGISDRIYVIDFDRVRTYPGTDPGRPGCNHRIFGGG